VNFLFLPLYAPAPNFSFRRLRTFFFSKRRLFLGFPLSFDESLIPRTSIYFSLVFAELHVSEQVGTGRLPPRLNLITRLFKSWDLLKTHSSLFHFPPFFESFSCRISFFSLYTTTDCPGQCLRASSILREAHREDSFFLKPHQISIEFLSL